MQLKRIQAWLKYWASAGWILLVGLSLSLMLAYFTWAGIRSYHRVRFDAVANQIENEIERRMDTYVNALIQTRALFEASEDVSRDEFRRYVRSIQLLESFPGIQGLGYSVRLLPEQVAGFESEMRREPGLGGYSVWPEFPRSEYYAITYLEPLDRRNERALGYDMATEPRRHEAMAKARDSGVPVTTRMVELVQEDPENQQPGFLIYVPVYARDARLHDVEARRSALRGFVYAPFRAHDLFKTIFAPGRKDASIPVQFEIQDGASEEDTGLLYSHRLSNEEPITAGHRSLGLSEERVLELPGRKWKLRVTPGERFFPAFLDWVPGVLGWVGALFTILMASLKISNQSSLVLGRRASFLSSASALLAESLDVQTTLKKVAKLVVPQFATWCVIHRLEDNGELRAIVISHEDPRRIAVAAQMSRKFPPKKMAPIGPYKVIETLRSDWVPKVRQREIAEYAVSQEHAEFIYGLEIRSFLCVAIISHGQRYGTLTLASSHVNYGAQDLQMAEELARRTAVALENAALYEASQNAIRLRDEFLSIASHELKTPITPLKLQLQALIRQVQKFSEGRGAFPADRVRGALDISLKSTNRLSRLVEDLLDVSRIMNGEMKFVRSPVSLGELVHDVVARYAQELADSGSELRVNIRQDGVGNWDPVRIDQVIMNLLSNSLKYGAGKPIEITVDSKDGQAILEVRDQGIGIAPENQERIFRRFERAITATKISGMGLGLYIVRMIVDAHGGKIRVKSELGQGSTFTVELPILASHAGTPDASSRQDKIA